MHQRSFRRFGATGTALALVTASAALGPSAVAASTAYDYTVILDSADGFSPISLECGGINSSGQVSLDGTSYTVGAAVLRGDGTTLTTIVDNRDGEYGSLGTYGTSINDAGQVAFSGSSTDDRPSRPTQIYRGDGRRMTLLADHGRFYSIEQSAINDNGRVAFNALSLDEGWGIFSVRRLGETSEYWTQESSEFELSEHGPTIHNNRVAFSARLEDDTYGVYTMLEGIVRTVAEDTGALTYVAGSSLGRRGQVAVHAYGQRHEAIMYGRGNGLHLVADNAGKFESFAEDPSINTLDEVAFSATLDGSGQVGVYVGPDPVTDKVVGPGDFLAASTVLNAYQCGLNDAGQVALLARLADGRNLIVRADPVSMSTAH